MSVKQRGHRYSGQRSSSQKQRRQRISGRHVGPLAFSPRMSLRLTRLPMARLRVFSIARTCSSAVSAACIQKAPSSIAPEATSWEMRVSIRILWVILAERMRAGLCSSVWVMDRRDPS